jgi:lipoprotein-anchoring transpeptidase ErfK/SrfK
VPWVMPFMGDYTFHGAPWRQAWGVPLSNGCVSMPTANAKYVYDWTPVGTIVNIHY